MGENPSRSAVTEILRLDSLAPAAMTVLLSCGIHQLYLQCTLYTVYEFLPRTVILELSTAHLFELFTRFCEQSKQASKMYLYRAFQDKETIIKCFTEEKLQLCPNKLQDVSVRISKGGIF